MKKIFSLLLYSLLALNIYSHPHVFIDIGMEIKDLENVKISWTFDLIESENKLYFFDDNGDGQLDAKEIKNFYNEGFKDLKNSNYFITVKTSGKRYPIEDIYNFNVTTGESKRLTISFDIKLPPIGEDNKISITHLDTSYFIDFSEPKNVDLKHGENLFTSVFKNIDKPFYYNPEAGRGEVIDTSKPVKGWLKAYPSEVIISLKPIPGSSVDTPINFKEQINQLQKTVYTKLSESLNNFNDRKSIITITYILLVAFLYGVIHALGPGHRKIIISSYILSREKISYFKAIGISLTSALIHSGSGILSILILNIVTLKIKPLYVENITNYTTLISFISVFILSILLIILKLFSKHKDENRPVGLSLIILSSLLPCPGAITIMLFSLSLNILGLGIITVIFMSLGIGLTLSFISLITLKSKTIVKRISNKKFNIAGKILEWLGLILLISFSIIMIYATY